MPHCHPSQIVTRAQQQWVAPGLGQVRKHVQYGAHTAPVALLWFGVGARIRPHAYTYVQCSSVHGTLSLTDNAAATWPAGQVCISGMSLALGQQWPQRQQVHAQSQGTVAPPMANALAKMLRQQRGGSFVAHRSHHHIITKAPCKYWPQGQGHRGAATCPAFYTLLQGHVATARPHPKLSPVSQLTLER